MLEKIANVGNLGDVVKVKNGYARNYLIPQGKAKRATAENQYRFAATQAYDAIVSQRIQELRENIAYRDTGLPLEWVPSTFWDVQFDVRTPINTPGGPLKGWELTYQQPFTFLSGFWSKFGVQMNYTHVDSDIEYLFSTAASNNCAVPMVRSRKPPSQ